MILGIYGAGGLGRELLELAHIINESKQCWDDFIFIVDEPSADKVSGVNVVRYNDLDEKQFSEIEFSIGIGEPATRKRIIEKLESRNASFSTLIHPDVHIPVTTHIGKGAVVQMGCFISCDVYIDDYVLIQPHVNIGHDCVINKHVVISSFCNMAGAVTVGRETYIGLGTCLREGITIGRNSIIGMASAVYKDMPDEIIAMGNPARPMKNNENHRVFK